MGKRVTVELDNGDYEVLKATAFRRSTSMANIIRDGLVLQRIILDSAERGERILIEKNGVAGELRLLIGVNVEGTKE